MQHRDIIVIGGSSGATAPLKALLAALPQDLPAAVFVVVHLPARSLGLPAMAGAAAAAGRLAVHAAADGMTITPGNVYLGVADHHLILAEGHIRLGRGPRENMARPAIDPLFRSAAASYGPRVIGVLLSGLLNDGAAGLRSIKQCGGLALVQDPADASASEMPLSGLRATTVDLSVAGDRIGEALCDLVWTPAGPRAPVPPELRLEVDIAAGEQVDSGVMRKLADPVALTCPSCGGVLSHMREAGPLRFRCQVGHAVTAETLAREQGSTIDEALRVALRIIEERAELVRRMAQDGREMGRRMVAEMYDERAAEYRRQAETLRRAVLQSPPYAAVPEAEPGE